MTSRFAAGLTLAAVLACSGLGVCWQQLAHEAHDCCAKSDTVASPARACASSVASEKTIKLAAPALVTPLFVVDVSTEAFTRVTELSSASPSAAKSPPLVLRI